ncbi:MAG TPA: SDR family oxidoreductase [Tepidisphaeraceae bacterium]|jgi:short-subunit dehydrogenase|nr:SDR family oxidoreductase [Tepidisphaeraceae bacterium]
MKTSLKQLDQQVIVITGASSGIGLATARLAASRGARLVLAARSSGALDQIVNEIGSEGGQAISVACDVSDHGQVQQIAERAIERFGRIDTWINNAGVSIYGRLEEVSEADSRRLFDTNFWGVCNGSLVALPYLKEHGGALINVGSEVSEAVVPLQGMYSASKHAVKGFTDALRIEVQNLDEAPVSITLIQPTAVDTPFPQHAKNYMAQEPKLPTPQIDPEEVAEAILNAATKPTRSKKVGTMSKVNTTMAKILPGVADKMSAAQSERQQYHEQPRHPQGALYRASETTTVVGQSHGPGGRQ